jgi:hypothetical protein
MVHRPVHSDVPVLMLVGRFDPYGGPGAATRAARTLERGWVVELPDRAYNVLGHSYCALAVRNAWIDRPTSPPDTTCTKKLRIHFALR